MTPIRLRVQELREALGWSQRDLAEKAGVRQATVSQAEQGGGVNLATLEKLANALDVNAAALIVHERPARKTKGT
ncbi:MAG: helix-turn-helix transcriptional regulator [Gemmatimonadota bacterium]|nr:helix-turn-helix transcriptional regulator [Gemmatimonadota bacterium]